MADVPDDFFDEDEEQVPIEPAPHTLPDKFTLESYNEYLTAEVLLPHGGKLKKARVIGCWHNNNGVPIGRQSSNPILDSCLYDVEFPDGSTESITANLIAENMFSQINDAGRMTPYWVK